MTDRELLEMAAKAFGITLRWSYLEDAELSPRRGDSFAIWNPLTDDGDALRLVVALEIDITFNRKYVTACAQSHAGVGFTAHDKDRNRAVRQTIVRAAAEIGKAMP